MQVYQSPWEVIIYDLDSPWLRARRPPPPILLLIRIQPTVICGCDLPDAYQCSCSAAYAIVLGKVEDLIHIPKPLCGCDLLGICQYTCFVAVYAIVLEKQRIVKYSRAKPLAYCRLPPRRVQDRFEYEAISPRCMVGSRQAEHESHRESMEEDDMVKSRQQPEYRRQTNGGGRRLQARGVYKGWLRPSQRLALAAPESSWDVAE